MVDDRAAMDIAQLVAEQHQAVYRYAYRLAGSVPDAEDLTQQVFMTAHEKLAQLRSRQCARSWLFTILRNHFLKSCQKRNPIPAENLHLNMDNVPSHVPDAAAIDRERLQQALDEIPPQYRLVLIMFYYESCSYREIAERLELPMGTVMSRLARAKARLRTRLFSRPAAEGHAVVGSQHSTAGHGG